MFRTRCQAVRMDDLTLVGDKVLDLSERGAMIACDEEMAVGQEVLMSFRAPWLGPHVVMLGEVRRVIEGWRDTDPGYAVGVKFLDLEDDVRRELAERLAPFPVIGRARMHAPDYAETVRRIHLGF